ncbi:MAG: ROK family protein [Planctomycetes bacterium]|nr:ROK family protein [Planctomycetota bacterium]
MAYAIGVDLGATKLEAGLVSSDGRVVRSHRVPTNAQQGIDAVLAALFAAVGEVRGDEPVAGVGLGLPGAVNHREGVVVHAPNARCLTGRNVVELCGRGIKEPVRVDNDANLFALGEYRFGAGQDARSMIGITLGTGVGGGIIWEGQVLRGADSVGAELGHMTFQYDGRMCGCGRLGCVEAYLSGTALEEIYLEYARSRGFDPDPQVNARRLFQMYENGEPAGRAIVDPFLSQFAHYMATLINVFNPEVIVVGGGIAAQPALWEEGVRRIPDACFAKTARINLKPAQTGDHAGVLGAAALILFPETEKT